MGFPEPGLRKAGELSTRDESSLGRPCSSLHFGLNQLSINGLCQKSYVSLAEAVPVSSTDVEEDEVQILLPEMEKEDGIKRHDCPWWRQFRAAYGMGRRKYHSLKRRQVKIETEAWVQAAKEYKELLNDMCEHKLAPNLPYMKSLFLGWFEPLRNRIAEEQELCIQGKCKAAYANYLYQLPADMMTVINMHELMGLLLTGNEHGTARVVQAACYIGDAVEQEVKKKDYIRLNAGDVIRFGQSSRLYIFQGPTDLMPPEADLKSMDKAKIREEMQDMEASLLRAKLEASLTDGISWGMREDAIEEAEDDVDEITWQNYKGKLTEKQEKTREKVVKRLEKIAHIKKEIDAIRAKDIAQGGLTQGQQTQIARNEQRISQIMEELENLEETLNESIRESMGARGGKTTHGKTMGVTEDDEDYMSDDDEFYDRTKKQSKRKTGENQSIETAESLLGKKEEIITEMEIKRKLLVDENEKVQPNGVAGEGDALDAYMSSVSSQLTLDKKDQLQKDLTSLQLELDRVLYLLKIADPTGEAARKIDSKAQGPIPNVATAASDAIERPPSEKGQSNRVKHSLNGSDKPSTLQNNSTLKESIANVTTESNLKLEGSERVADHVSDDLTTAYTVVKPQWLGVVADLKKLEQVEEAPVDMQEKDQFVDYKDRKTILEKADIVNETLGIENAAAGLIIRKRKQVEKPDINDVRAFENSAEAKRKVEDTVAMLLRHSRAYHASDKVGLHVENDPHVKLARKDKTAQRVLGPERPSFLSNESECDSWVPPEGTPKIT